MNQMTRPSMNEIIEINDYPKAKSYMKTSSKITAIFILAILTFMFLYHRHQSKFMELEQMQHGINSEKYSQFDFKVQHSLEFDKNCMLCKYQSKTKVHLVTNFFPMTVIKGHARILRPGAQWSDKDVPSSADSKKFIQQRDRELLDVLQMNLNNNYIAAIHIIYHKEQVIQHILAQRLRFTHKLIFHWVSSPNPTYEDAMLYVGKYLLNQLVVISNQDVYLDRGWQVLDHQKIKDRKLMYALTRHGRKERYCKMPDNCARSAPYVGSHDAFAFILTEMPRTEDLALLRHSHDQFGIENIMIFVFQTKLGYEVINPCFVLYIYHVHCARVFSKKRLRINRYDTTGTARFIDQLYV